jgi:uncharacterized protein YndB with AHSA1/START domain
MPASDRSHAADAAFVIRRRFEATRRRVWQAWSEADEMQAWWGPKGCSIKLITFEFRPGGFFHYAMRFSNGPQMWGRFLYRDIAAPERITWLNSFSNEGCGITRAPFDPSIPLEILNEATFSAEAGRTLVTLRARPHGASESECRTFAAMFQSLETGYGGTFDQLARSLAKA